MAKKKGKSPFVIAFGEEILLKYNKGLSIETIAKDYDTYPQRIYRVLVEVGATFRNRSEAQKQALVSGRAKHPSEGKELTEEHKTKIGQSVYKTYQDSPDEYKKKKKKLAKEQFDALPDHEKERRRKKATEGILKAAREGSKLEHFLVDKLTSDGYNVVFHKKGYIINDELEIDILLPAHKIAIEVDGIFHEQDVWNDGSLPKITNKDAEKNGLLLNNGYVVIRLRNIGKGSSKTYMTDRWETLDKAIRKIKKSFPPESERLIYI